jgi:hypothetical protein
MILEKLKELYAGKCISEEIREEIYFCIDNYIKSITKDVQYCLYSVNISQLDGSYYVNYHNLQTAMLIHKDIVIPKFADTYEDTRGIYHMEGDILRIRTKQPAHHIKTTFECLKPLSKNELEINILKEKVKSFFIRIN